MIIGNESGDQKNRNGSELADQHADDSPDAEIKFVRGGNGEEIIIDPACAVEPKDAVKDCERIRQMKALEQMCAPPIEKQIINDGGESNDQRALFGQKGQGQRSDRKVELYVT